MIYKIIRPIVRFASKLYFGKIYLDGLENIPQGKPLIIVCNHPTAFIEPCLLACFLPLNLHFLVRGDLFSLSWLSWLLKGTKQIPIFRQRDGVNNVKKNLITQEAIVDLFKNNDCLLMFPEGHTHENIFIKPLKKGLARFAFLDDNPDLEILTVGVNFDKNVKFGSKASIIIGKTISVSEFKDKHEGTTAQMYKAFLEKVYAEMKKNVRHIQNEEREEVIQKVYECNDMLRKSAVLPLLEHGNDSFLLEKEIATSIDMDMNLYHSFQDLLSNKDIPKVKKPSSIDLLFMVLLLPIFLLAAVIHFVPVQITAYIVKSKITEHEFKAPVFMAVMIFLYIFLAIFSLILLPFVGIWSIYYLVLAMIVGYLAKLYYQAYYFKWKYIFLSKKQRNEYEHMVNELLGIQELIHQH